MINQNTETTKNIDADSIQPTKKKVHFFSNVALEEFLVTAFEGGINYWASDGWEVDKSHTRNEIADKYKKKYAYHIQDHPYYCYLPIIADDNYFISFKDIDGSISRDSEGKVFKLTKKSLLKGLDVMKEEHPSQYAELKDNYDANTCDLLIQCALFGTVVYG